MVSFAGQELLRLMTIEQKGDLVVGDDVAVDAICFEMGACLGGPEGQLPESPSPVVVPGREQNFSFPDPEKGVFFDRDEFAARLLDGKRFGIAALAEVPDRTEETGRLFGGAKGLAQLHESGIEKPGLTWIEKTGRVFP
jgi:hypothetical protein